MRRWGFFEAGDINYNGKLYHSEGVSIANHLQESISVYPNPTSGQLYISAEGIQKVEVFDLHGRLVMMSRDANTLNLSHLTSGLYAIRVYTTNGTSEKGNEISKFKKNQNYPF